MRLCQQHSDMCDETLQNHGLWSLVQAKGKFNPVLALHTHISCYASKYLPQPLPVCPLCEFERREHFDSVLAVDELVSDMAKWAREQHMIPQLH